VRPTRYEFEDMKSQRVFISGIAGFLGSHLADHLLAQGHRVSGCDTLMHGGEKSNVPLGAEFHQCDAKNHERMRQMTKEVDVVFHAAALGHDGYSVVAPHLITENLFSSTSSLVSAAAANRVRRFVYCSSMARYGKSDFAGGGLFDETMPCRPLTPYGVAKVASEELVKSVCETHGVEWTICVPHNIIGPRQRYDDPYRNVASIMINCLLQEKAPVIYGDGEQKRCFSSIWDTLSALEPLLFSPLARGEVFNLGPDEEFVTVNQLYQQLSKIMNKDLPPRHLPGRPLEVKEANCSADKARRMFGYQTRVSLQEALEELVAWISEKGPRPFLYTFSPEIVNEKTPLSWKEPLF